MKSKEYKQKLNEILRTSQNLTLSVAQDDIRKMQLLTILIRSQIVEAIEMIGEKNNIEE